MTTSNAGPSMPWTAGSVSSGTSASSSTNPAGPTVGEDQRHPVPAGRLRVHEVDRHPVERDPELRVRVQLPLPAVEPVRPVGEQAAQVPQLGALVPADPRHLIGPPGGADARPQVGEHLVIDVDPEGLDRHDDDPTIPRRRQVDREQPRSCPRSRPPAGSGRRAGSRQWRLLGHIGFGKPGKRSPVSRTCGDATRYSTSRTRSTKPSPDSHGPPSWTRPTSTPASATSSTTFRPPSTSTPNTSASN